MTTTLSSHWDNMRAERTLLDAERFARLVAHKLTKQTDLAVVQAAHDGWCDARDAYVDAYRAASDAIDANTDPEARKFPGWLNHESEYVQRVHEVMSLSHEKTSGRRTPKSSAHHSNGESYPLSQWLREAQTLRAWAKRLRAVVEPN